MGRVRYVRPVILTEACSALAAQDPTAEALAGGTDLLVQWQRGDIAPECLVDLKALGLDRVEETPGGGLRLGALCTLNSLLANSIVKQRCKVLTETIAEMGSVQVRNRATIGGNLCNASPAADLAPPLSVLGARVLVTGVKGSRELALADFFLGPGKTALLPGEILTEVLLAPRRKGCGTVYLKHKRNAMDLAVVGVAVSLVMEDLQTCSEANLVLGAVGPTPLSGRRAAEVLQQAKFSKETVDEAASLAAEEAQPINDMRASGWYRRILVQVLTGRAIREAYERAKK